jgi:hypothetical protein
MFIKIFHLLNNSIIDLNINLFDFIIICIIHLLKIFLLFSQIKIIFLINNYIYLKI